MPLKSPLAKPVPHTDLIETTVLTNSKGTRIGRVDKLTGRLYTLNGTLSEPGTRAHQARRGAANALGVEITPVVRQWEDRKLLATKQGGSDA